MAYHNEHNADVNDKHSQLCNDPVDILVSAPSVPEHANWKCRCHMRHEWKVILGF